MKFLTLFNLRAPICLQGILIGRKIIQELLLLLFYFTVIFFFFFFMKLHYSSVLFIVYDNVQVLQSQKTKGVNQKKDRKILVRVLHLYEKDPLTLGCCFFLIVQFLVCTKNMIYMDQISYHMVDHRENITVYLSPYLYIQFMF